MLISYQKKFLRAISDNKLSWKEHISHVSSKVAKGIAIISKVRKYLDRITLLNLYSSFIYPYLTYCNQVWGFSCQSYMSSLVKLQKRAVRIISVVHPRTHTDPLFINCKLLKCYEINKHLVGRLMYRMYNINQLHVYKKKCTSSQLWHPLEGSLSCAWV